MSQERLAMRKIKEILRLKWEADLLNRAISRACKISHSTVSETLRRAGEAGSSRPLPEDLGKIASNSACLPRAFITIFRPIVE